MDGADAGTYLPPWRRTSSDTQFPGVPAWGRPTSRLRLGDFPLSLLDDVTPSWAWGGSTGRGTRVCVLDSGIDGTHPLVAPIDRAMTVEMNGGVATVTVAEQVDPAGHGTACAGIIRSLAPEASISSVCVFNEGFGGTGAALIEGLRWAILEGFDVVNLSLSTRRADFQLALYELADLAYYMRVTLVVSAHNMPVRSFPWPYASVLSVASHDEPDPLVHHYNPSPPVEFLARGVSVPVAWPNGGRIRTTGNSFAAPHISGLCAMILGKHRWLTPFQLKTVLYLTAHNVRVMRAGGHADDRVPVG